MNEKIRKLTAAILDALVNSLAIFTLTVGSLILATGNLQSFALEPALLTATGVALMRFSLRLYEEEGIDLAGLEELPGVPDVNSESNIWTYCFSRENTLKLFKVV